MNNRHKLVIALGAGARAALFGAFAQQERKILRVDFLLVGNCSVSSVSNVQIDAFLRCIRELAYIKGKNPGHRVAL